MKKVISFIAAAVVLTSSLPAISVYADTWVKTDSGYSYKYDDGTKAKSGWLTVDKKKYYIDKNGCRQTGWLSFKNGEKYYFDKNGVMYSAKWLETKKGKYYFLSSGKMATGTIKIASKKYTFDDNGILQEEKQGTTVYITKTGKKYHKDSHCNGGTYYAVYLEDLGSNYKPCKKCCD